MRTTADSRPGHERRRERPLRRRQRSVAGRGLVAAALAAAIGATALAGDPAVLARGATVVAGDPAASAAEAAAGRQQAVGSTFTMALTGDSIITRRLSVYEEPEFVEMIGLIRGADVAFTNLEMLFHDYEMWPAHQSGGTWMRGDPELAGELVWAGFDLVSRANNHTGDYGVEGMRMTTRHVREAGLVQAGVGESLEEATEAKFLETAGGRVALISVASTFPDHSAAGTSRGDIPSRPGLNPLRYTTRQIVPRDAMEALRQAALAVGNNVPEAGDRLRAFRTTWELGERRETRTSPDPEDVRRIAAVVDSASRLAEYTIVTIHAHEGAGSRFVPAEFLVTFARAMVDAGADVFVGHGPHVLRAIEMYRGKPIFYSLGDFIFQNETLLRLPQENYAAYDLGPDQHVADFNGRRYDNDRRGFPAQREIWEAVIAMPEFRGDELVAIELHPISLGFGQPPSVRGRPLLAGAELGRKIIDDLTRLSADFGTTVRWHDGIGVVDLQ